jgi:hypothetical protein
MQPSEMRRLTISDLLLWEAQTVRIGEETKRAQGA